MSYAALCALMMAIAAAGAAVLLLARARVSWSALGIGLAVVLAMTAVFDSLMIKAGLFGYSPETLLGLHVGAAPIEDFSYAVVASVLGPLLFCRLSTPWGTRSGCEAGTAPAASGLPEESSSSRHEEEAP